MLYERLQETVLPAISDISREYVDHYEVRGRDEAREEDDGGPGRPQRDMVKTFEDRDEDIVDELDDFQKEVRG